MSEPTLPKASRGHQRKTGVFERLRRLLTGEPSPESEASEARLNQAIKELRDVTTACQRTVAQVKHRQLHA